MRILLVHNRYQQYGGEDAVFDAEAALLEGAGHEVIRLVFDNEQARGALALADLAWRSIYNPTAVARVQTAIREHRPDVLHTHNLFYVASAGVYGAARGLGVPTVATLHNYRLICAGALLMREGRPCELCVHKALPVHGVRHRCHRDSAVQSAQLTLNTGFHKLSGTYRRQVSRFIALTPFARARMLDSSLGIAPGQIIVKPNSSPDGGFVMPEGRQSSPYLYIGRLTPDKGVDVALEAAAQGGFALTVAGAGELEGLVRDYAARYPQITYAGFAGRPQIAALMGTARGLIFPSRWYEGLPMTLLEAFSRGLPVLVSALDNLSDIVPKGVAGRHFEAGDAGSLARAIAAYERDDEPGGRLAHGARALYEAHYTPEANLRALEGLYRELVHAQGHGAGAKAKAGAKKK